MYNVVAEWSGTPSSVKLLSDEFLSQFPDSPAHMNELASFVFYRTYSRWLPEKGRRETWKEAVVRAVNYNVGIAVSMYNKNRFAVPYKAIVAEAEKLFRSIFNTKQFLSGRTHWVGGAEGGVADKFPLANFNCSFLNITKWDDMADLFYLLLVGTGVGFKCTKEMAANLPPIRTNVNLIHSPYEPVEKNMRLEDTALNTLENGFAKILVGDSKEGWVKALKTYLMILTNPEFESIHTVKISYNSVRPKGERLKTFGGTASGYEPLKEMFEGFDKVIKNQIDPGLEPLEVVNGVYAKVRPIHVLDMGNLVGNNVVVGGVRRTAEIFLFDADDYEVMLAKYGINGFWEEDDIKHHHKIGLALAEQGILPKWWGDIKAIGDGRFHLNHRRMSNNSIAFESKPSAEFLELVFLIMQGEGEPGFVNLEEARRRRPNAEGLNPCAEILLDSYGVCNLTTVNVDGFVQLRGDNGYVLDYDGLMEAQALSTRAGIRMTCLDLEIPHWDAVQKRDRLIGTSLTGWQDALGKLGYTEAHEAVLLEALRKITYDTALEYSQELRIPMPLLTTTVKPEGTLSQVAGGVSSGLHVSHAPYFIRRIRINAADPLAKAVAALGWRVNPEVGTPGETYEERMANARTLVIDFPVKSGAKKTRDDQDVRGQFDTYFRFQNVYTAHNSSNTISVRKHEWDTAREIVWENWDNFVGVSFLEYAGGNYELAPYEECTKEQYEELKSLMKPFDPTILQQFEQPEEEFEILDEACSTGACPIR